MKSAFPALALIVTSLSLAARQSDPVDAIVRAEMTRQRIPGVAVAVSRGGQTIKAQGYGLANVEHDVPVTDETIFQSGSLGKQFTAAVVMLMVEDGKLALSDPLTKFFPDAPRELAAHHGSASPDAHVGHRQLHRREGRLSARLHGRRIW